MYVEIENQQTIDRDFPNKNSPGSRWYVREQQGLLFKDGSKYPDKFLIPLSFSSDQSEQQKVGGFSPGQYVFSDDAFTLNNNSQIVIDGSKLRPVKKPIVKSDS
jgi:hypothetical protein